MKVNGKQQPIQVIKASAGSGKTYQLAYEYIKLLLGEKQSDGEWKLKSRTEYHQHILAVTFTNKATEEMKIRIVNELKKLSEGNGDYVQSLLKELHTDIDKLKKAALVALEEVLFNYTTFNVSTIDSFFQTVLRTFAFELDFDYNYEVELDDNYAVSVAVHSFLSKVAGDSNANNIVFDWVGDFMKGKLESGSSWNVFSADDLIAFAKNIGKEFYQTKKQEIAKYLADVVDGITTTRVNTFKGEVKKRIKDLNDNDLVNIKTRYIGVLNSAGLSGIADLSPKSGLAFMTKFVNNDIEPKNADIDKFLDGKESKVANWSSEKIAGKPWKANAKAGAYDAAWSDMQTLVGDLKVALFKKRLLVNVLSNIYLFGLLGVINKELEDYVKENNVVLLSDTNQLLRDVVADGNVPFVYERLGTWINHFLVDEFQDTSALQYGNLKPLLEESAGSGNENLIIGDEKQCIYRFRNSDPKLLQSTVAEDFKKCIFVDDTKVVNYRSADNIIKFNNLFFDSIVDYLDMRKTYSNLLQDTNSRKRCNNGAVKVRLIPKELSDFEYDGAGPALGEDGEKVKTDVDFEVYVLNHLPEVIDDALSRGYQMKDIAILVNTNLEGAKVIERILDYNQSAERKIETMSAESMFLNKSSAVRLVISNLRYFDSVNMTVNKDGAVSSSRDKESKVKRVLRNFGMKCNGQKCDGVELGNLLKQSFVEEAERQPNEQVLTDEPQYNAEYLSLRDEFMSGAGDSLSLVSIIENIINRVIGTDDKEHEKAYLVAFMDCVIDYSSRYTATIHSFLKWWDSNKSVLSINLPGGTNAVNIMTIHKSKGLEFPCVIIPFADWEMCRTGRNLWIDKDMLLKSDEFKGIDDYCVPPVVPVSTMLAKDVSAFEPAYKAECSESIVDSLNKTYVAFTRAVNEMHIFAKIDKEKTFDDVASVTIGDLFQMKMKSLTQEEAVKATNDKFAAKTGKPADIAAKVVDESNEIIDIYTVGDLNQQYDPDFGKKPQPELERSDLPAEEQGLSKEIPVLESGDVALELCVPESYNSLQENGIKLHRMLSTLRYKRDKHRVLTTAYRRGLIRNCKAEAEEVVEWLLTDEQTAGWYADDNKVLNERAIFLPKQVDENGIALPRTRRPDRIVKTRDGEVIVIDYKFGEDRSKDEAYQKQVARYIRDLKEAGQKVTQGYVCYPQKHVVLPVE